MVDKELLNIFISESNEEINKINKISLSLSKGFNKNVLIELDRLLHTLKGNSSLMGYNDFSDIAHRVEDVLKKVNSRKVPLNNDLVDLMLSASDWMSDYIKNINKGKAPKKDNSNLLDSIKKIGNQKKVKLKKIKTNSSDVNVNDFKYQTGETVRIKNQDLDILLNLSSELGSILDNLGKFENNIIFTNHLNSIKNQLQQKIINLRLISLDDVFSNYPRMVRDLCISEDKEVNLKIITNGIKLDRSIIEHINAPMVHLLRNAIDHGIEKSSERLLKNKHKNGSLIVSVEKEKSSAIIKVSDDGKGINLNEIIRTAINKKLLSESESKNISKNKILDFIFLPEFSTKNKVTKVSGRGIGMNIVKNNILQMGGSIKIETQMNKGTSFILKVPLNLSIINALIVGNNENKFAIPLINISNVEKFNKKFETNGKYHYKDKKYPFFTLNNLMNLRGSSINDIIILDVGNEKQILGVENIFDKKEILIKKTDKILNEMKGIGGSTILNQDDVCFILDINTLLEVEE